jgi:hypothetical protein
LRTVGKIDDIHIYGSILVYQNEDGFRRVIYQKLQEEFLEMFEVK